MNLRSLLVGAAALLALMPVARATPITYTIDANGFGDTVTGTFTFDSTTPSLLSLDITVSGPLDPAVFTAPLSAAAPGGSCTSAGVFPGTYFTFGPPLPGSCFIAENAADSEVIGIAFDNLLSTTADSVSVIAVNGPAFIAADTIPTGSADPVPEPASLAIFGAGIAMLGVMRRKRKTS